MMASNVDGSRLDSKFVLDANRPQHKAIQDEIAVSLKRAVHTKQSKMEHLEKVVPVADLRNQLRALYQSTYSESPEFEQQTSRVLEESIKKMYMQSTQKRKNKPQRSLPRQSQDDSDDSSMEIKPRKAKRQKRDPEQFTPSWNASILKKKIKVWWPLDGKYYRGVVSKVKDHRTKSVLIKYSDGDKEWLNLRNEKFMFYTVTSSDDDDDEDDNDNDNDNDGDGEYDQSQNEQSQNEQNQSQRDDSDESDDDDGHDEEDEDSWRSGRSRKLRKAKLNKKKRRKHRKKRKHKKDKHRKRKRSSISEVEEDEGQNDNASSSFKENEEQKVNLLENVSNESNHQTPSHLSSRPNTNDVDTPSNAMNVEQETSPLPASVGGKGSGNFDGKESEMEQEESGDFDALIDCHVTITIDGNRYDGIPEQKKVDEDGNTVYQIKFDASNERESEWVTADQIEHQRVTTCDKFKIGDQVEVRENNEWMEVEAQIDSIYQGATGIIAKVGFPEFDDGYYMYLQERDVRKK